MACASGFIVNLKAAMRPVLMDGNWVDRLPWVMLGLRLAPKEDMSPLLS